MIPSTTAPTSRTVDRLVAEDAERALADDDDQQGDRERRGRDDQRERERRRRRLLMPSQPMVLNQLSRPGSDDRLAERRGGPPAAGPCRSSVPSCESSPTKAEPTHVADDDREDRGDEPELEEVERHQRPDEERRRDEVGREPDREDPADRPVAGRLRDRLHSVGSRSRGRPRGWAFPRGASCRSPSGLSSSFPSSAPLRGPITGVAPPCHAPPAGLVNVTASDAPPWWTTLRAGSVSATTRRQPDDPAGGRPQPDRLRLVGAVEDHEVRWQALLHSPRHLGCTGRVGGDHLVGAEQLVPAGHLRDVDEHREGVEHRAAPERVPGIHDRVVAAGHVHAGGVELLDARHAAPLGVGVEAALEDDVVERVGDDRHAGALEDLEQLEGVVVVVARHRRRVAGDDPALHPVADRAGGDDLEEPALLVIGLVAVEVDRAPRSPSRGRR